MDTVLIPTIFSIGKGVPAYSLEQAGIAQRLIQRLKLDDEDAWMLEKIYKNSNINRRYSVLPDLLIDEPGKPAIGMSARNAIYKKEAPLLAEKAAREALSNWGRPTDEITHIISVSCTGAITPGIEFKLTQALRLDPFVTRLGINMMGCFGAFKGLSVAHKIACESPKNRVLLVCTELCSLHFHLEKTLESTVIHSLFADGSGAAIVGAQPRAGEHPLFELVGEKCYAMENSQQEMTWDACDFGFDMTLSARVPGLIEQNIGAFVKALAGTDKDLHTFDWAIHPGGKAIIEATQKALKLDHSHTCSSWNVLANYGNLSSATFLYVLADLKEKGTRGKHSIGLGFGPGLSIEGILLRNMDK